MERLLVYFAAQILLRPALPRRQSYLMRLEVRELLNALGSSTEIYFVSLSLDAAECLEILEHEVNPRSQHCVINQCLHRTHPICPYTLCGSG